MKMRSRYLLKNWNKKYNNDDLLYKIYIYLGNIYIIYIFKFKSDGLTYKKLIFPNTHSSIWTITNETINFRLA